MRFLLHSLPVNSILCRCSLTHRARTLCKTMYIMKINVNTQIHTVRVDFLPLDFGYICVVPPRGSRLGAVRGLGAYISPLSRYSLSGAWFTRCQNPIERGQPKRIPLSTRTTTPALAAHKCSGLPQRKGMHGNPSDRRDAPRDSRRSSTRVVRSAGRASLGAVRNTGGLAA